MRDSTGSRYLIFTTFVTGTIIMVIELIGSRVIGPPFGVSLFVWTSLITVTLVSLALGYWIGGRLADSKASPLLLYLIILASGVYLVAIPLLKGFILEPALSLGLRAGSLVSSTVLFGPPLFLLGMVTPYIVKLYMAEDSSTIGKTVGWLYAVSTCGSFTGTLITGFVLIPNIGVNNIIYLSSFILISLTAGYLVLFRGKRLSAALVIVPAVLLFTPARLPSVTRPDGTLVTLLANEDTAYGQIKVVDYSYGDAHLRELLLDNIIQGGIDMNTGLSIFSYPYYIERLSLAYNKDAKNALVVGLGCGVIPRDFKAYRGLKTDVVEINKRVADIADKYFSFNGSADSVYIGDGRYFLKSGTSGYDIIVLDAFSGDTTPSHLMSLESFELVKKRLSDNGVLLINFIGGNLLEDQAVPTSLFRTLKEVFKNVDVYTAPGYDNPMPSVINLTFVAYDGLRDVKAAAQASPVYPPLKEDVEGIYARKIALDAGPFLFTDDYNPIDFYDVRLRERFRTLTIRTSDRAIVVN